MASFKIPLNLPHAGTIAGRIAASLRDRTDPRSEAHQPLLALVSRLQALLLPCQVEGENPERGEAERIREAAAGLGREIVDEVERLELTGDRLGQCVRNLFECLELGEEGAALSLRAGENPASPQRPS